MLKKAACVFVCGLLCFGSVCCGEEVDRWPTVDAKAFVLIDRHSGRVLYGRNENEILPIASTTKIMTALIAIENCELREMVVVSERASGVPGTSIYLGLNERLSMEQMLEAIMLRSANDAAVAIAEHIDGDVVQFAERMNVRAKTLSADAYFVNPNGLDQPGHGASALGLATIAREAMNNPVFRRLAFAQGSVIPWRDSQYDRVLSNKNKLLRTYPGATGIKTGFTKKAGRCLVFSAERDRMELIGVVLNCGAWFDAAAGLMDYAFTYYRVTTLFEEKQTVVHIPVMGGAQQVVHAVAGEPLSIPLSADEEAVIMVDVPDMLFAPVERGAEVGVAWAEVDGVKVCEIKLVAQDGVGEWGFIPALTRIARQWAIRFA